MTRVLSLLFVCMSLLCSSHAAQAQGLLSAVRLDGIDTTANFTIGLSRLDSTSLETTALASDQVRLTGTISPELEHVGQQADIYVVVRIGNLYYMRNQAGTFVPWNGVVATLVPYLAGQQLSENLQLELFVGNIPVTGRLEWYLGYKSTAGVLIYNRAPHLITVTQQGASWPLTRPYMVLSNFTAAARNSAAYDRFAGMVDRWVGGSKTDYNYSPIHTVIGYALTGDQRYLQNAVAEVDSYVDAQIAKACGAQRYGPDFAGDSYLSAGDAVMRIALTYDHGYDLLSAEQRAKWLALMEQTTNNIFGDPAKATWGGAAMGCAARTVAWSGWAVSPPYGPSPGNNYYFSSFAKAAMALALTTRDQKWLDLVQLQVRPLLTNYYADKLPEGGSREGTGYGVAHFMMFDSYALWRASTGEDWSKTSTHAKNSMLYWMHATVPTLDRFIPIGDQSRSSQPQLYDYHRALVALAQALGADTAEAKQAQWWLDNISVKRMSHGFNSQFDLLKFNGGSEKPVQLSYHAKGAGAYFARSSWEKDATLFSLIAGQYEQDHLGQEQGNFTFYKNTWLAVTSNIWSHSGIQQGTESRNVLRFERTTNGVIGVIGQNKYSDALAPVLTETIDSDGTRRGNVDLSPAYSRNSSLVRSWKRDFAYKDNKVTIHDVCSVGDGVTPVWQVHVPVQPSYDETTGRIVAGQLTVTPQMAVKPTVKIEEMRSINSDYAAGRYRVSLYSSNGCDFTVDLEAR